MKARMRWTLGRAAEIVNAKCYRVPEYPSSISVFITCCSFDVLSDTSSHAEVVRMSFRQCSVVVVEVRSLPECFTTNEKCIIGLPIVTRCCYC